MKPTLPLPKFNYTGLKHCLFLALGLVSLFSANSYADILLEEYFASGTLPAGWSTNATGTSANPGPWLFDNVPPMNSTSGTYYAYFNDEDLVSANIGNVAYLETAPVDFTGRTQAFLSFEHYWEGVEDTYGRVFLSNDGGATWILLQTNELITRGSLAAPQLEVINITAQAAGQADVRIRFEFDDGGLAAKFWYVDDVKLYTEPDVGIEELVSPAHLTCSPNTTYSASETVSVRIRNHGVLPVSNIPVTVNVTGGTTVTLTGTFTGTIPGGQSVIFTLPGTIDMSADDAYHFDMTTNLPTDAYLANDSHIDGRRQYVQAYPYDEDFAFSNSGWKAERADPLNESRDFIWGNVPYLGGPAGNGESIYLEINQNGYDDVWMLSPTYDFTGLVSPVLSLDVKYQLDAYYNRVIIEYTTNGGASWTRLGNGGDPLWYNSIPYHSWNNNEANPVNNWTRQQHELCNLVGESCVQFRMKTWVLYYTDPTSGNPRAQFAFDNFAIQETADVALVAYQPIDVGCDLNPNQTLAIEVFNYGCTPAWGITATCNITGAYTGTLTGTIGASATSTTNPPIPPGGSRIYTFPGTFDMTALGTYNFNTTLTWASDTYAPNNTLTQSLNVSNIKVSNFPYTADFNGSTQNWVAKRQDPTNNTRDFLHGTIPYLNGPDGQGDSWYLNVTGNGYDDVWVESPVFDFSNVTKPEFSMDIKYQLDNYYNRVIVEYSLDGGGSWTRLGNSGDPNWYNHPSYHSWNNNEASPVDTWTNVRYELCELSGQSCVTFRVKTWVLYYMNPTSGNPRADFAFDNVVIQGNSEDDVECKAILLPDGGGCGNYSNAENVQVLVQNNTCRDLDSIQITIDMTGPTGTFNFTEMFPTQLMRQRYWGYQQDPENRMIFDLAGTLDMSVPGTYTITATATRSTDINTSNDSRTETRVSLSPINTFPHIADFNADNNGWRCNTPDSARYFNHKDPLPYLGGPQGQGGCWWINVDDNGYNDIWVESPTYDLSALTSPILTLDVKHRLDAYYNRFIVEYSTNGGGSWTRLGTDDDPRWYENGNYDSWNNSEGTGANNPGVNSWKEYEYGLCAVAGQSCVKFRVKSWVLYYGTWATWPRDYFAFDNFQIRDENDVGVLYFEGPVEDGCLYDTQEPVTVRVHNWGCITQTNVPVTCDVTSAVTTTLTGTVPSIPPQSSVSYTFPTTINMTGVGTYNLSAYTSLPGDLIPVNDDADTTINVNIVKVDSYPYCADFNGGTQYWTAMRQDPTNNTRDFVHGAVPYLNGPDGQGDSWYLEVTGNGHDDVWVESPVFDFTNQTNPTLSLDVKYQLDNYYNRVIVEYSLDGGISWTRLGNSGDPNWYNHPSYHSWNNNEAAPVDSWTNQSYPLCILSGEPCVKFRVKTWVLYYMNHTSGNDRANFAFDNFCISATEPDDVAPRQLTLAPACSDCGNTLSNAENIEVLVENYTCRPLYDVPVVFTSSGPTNVTWYDTIPGPIPSFGRVLFTFDSTLDMSVTGVYDFTVTTNLSTDGTPANDVHTERRYNNVVLNTIPYSQDFTTYDHGWTSRTTNATRAFLQDTLPYLGGSAGDNCFYLDVRQNGWLGDVWVESPTFDFTGIQNPRLSIDAKHRLDNYYNRVTVEYSTNGGNTWTRLGSASSPNWYHNNYDSWNHSETNPVDTFRTYTHDLCPLAEEPCVRLRIRTSVTYYNENRAFFAFDNIEITDAPDVDVVAFLSPNVDPCVYPEPKAITVEVYNAACVNDSLVPIHLNVTGPSPMSVVDTIPVLNAGGFTTFTFRDSIVMATSGTYNFDAWIVTPGDINPGNDHAIHVVNLPQDRITSLPYIADFNGSTQGWLAGRADPTSNTRDFLHGAVPYLNGPQGQGDSWYLDITANGYDDVWVESPVFDFTSVINPKLTLDVKHQLDRYYNRVIVEYSTNGGGSWTRLGNGGTPNWYNHPSYHSWNDSEASPVDNWTTMTYDLCELVAEPCVKFRVKTWVLYYTNPTSGNDRANFAFDNVRITDNPIDAAVRAVSGCYGAPYYIDVTLEHVFHCEDRFYSENYALNSSLTASSQLNATSHSVQNLINGSYTSYWQTATSTSLPAWVEFDLGTPQIVNTLRLTESSHGSAATRYNPRDWTVEAWDGSAWVTLDTQTGQALNNNEYTEFIFGNTMPYQRYRLNITAVQNGVDWLLLGEVGLFFSEPIILDDIDFDVTINGSTTTVHRSNLNMLPGDVQVIQLTGFTIPDQSASVRICCKNPNFASDDVIFNDCVDVDLSQFPDCNDHCIRATALGVGATQAGQTSNATPDPSEDPTFSTCGGVTVENTVWYRFTTGPSSTDSITVTIDSMVCSPALAGVQVAILEVVGTPCTTGGFNEIFCSNNGDTTAVQFGPVVLDSMRTYYIAIDGYANNDCDLRITIDGNVTEPDILPAEMRYFEAYCQKNTSLLQWETISERGTAYFEIQRRHEDDDRFRPIGQVRAQGQSDDAITYHFIDQNPMPGTNYYRLRQVDTDGTARYTQVVALTDCNDPEQGFFSLQPNPASEQTQLIYESQLSGKATLNVIDNLGRILSSNEVGLQKGLNRFDIPLSNLAKGAYYIELKNEQISKQAKLIVE